MIFPMSSARWPRTSMISPDERIVLLILFSPSVAFSIVLIPLCTSSRERLEITRRTLAVSATRYLPPLARGGAQTTEEHTSELQTRLHLQNILLIDKKNQNGRSLNELNT